MAKPSSDDKDEGQKKLTDFNEISENAESPPTPTPMKPASQGPEQMTTRPKSRKQLIEEESQLPEVMRAFKEAEKKIVEKIAPEEVTRQLASNLTELGIPRDHICTIIVTRVTLSSVWKVDPRMIFRWLSPDYKHQGRAEAGRKGGKASHEARKEPPNDSSVPANPVNLNDDLVVAPPSPDLSTAPEKVPEGVPNQLAPSPDLQIADLIVSKAGDLVENVSPKSAYCPPQEDYPRPPIAYYLVDIKSAPVFRTAASAAL
jgi:hypothetical protein